MYRTSRLVVAAAAALALASAPSSAAAQAADSLAKTAVYMEAGGNAVLLSVNFDRLLTNHLAFRVGMNAIGGSGGDNDTGVLVVPVMLSLLAGNGASRAEFGAGAGFSTGELDFGELGDVDLDGIYGTATLGYRYQPPAGGVIFRAGFTPLLINEEVWPWVGVSVGYAF